MVVYEEQQDGTVKAYSDQGMMIHGGFPEGLYVEAYDPKELNRTYVETDIPVPQEEEPEEN
jgi:hypothetical protein